MKNYLLFFLTIQIFNIQLAKSQSKEIATIEFKFDKIPDNSVFYISEYNSTVLDSALSRNNKFVFKYEFNGDPKSVVIENRTTGYAILLWLDSPFTQVSVTEGLSKVTGSKIMSDLGSYQAEISNLEIAFNNALIRNENKADSIKKEIQDISFKYINNDSSYFSLILLFENIRNKNIDILVAKQLVKKYSSSFLNTDLGKELVYYLNTFKEPKVGEYASQFFVESDGKKIYPLKENIGKYILLTFWAGWCSPCMRELPYLKQIYEEQRKNNLVIIGISFDKERKDYLKVINKNGLMWQNLHVPEGFHSYLSNLYGINALPRNILISPEGKLINVKIYPEEIEAALGLTNSKN